MGTIWARFGHKNIQIKDKEHLFTQQTLIQHNTHLIQRQHNTEWMILWLSPFFLLNRTQSLPFPWIRHNLSEQEGLLYTCINEMNRQHSPSWNMSSSIALLLPSHLSSEKYLLHHSPKKKCAKGYFFCLLLKRASTHCSTSSADIMAKSFYWRLWLTSSLFSASSSPCRVKSS